MTTGRYVALDFETSGYAAHSACAVGLCRIEDGVVTDSFYSLIRPPSSRVLFTHVHGLTWPMLKDAPTFTELWPQLVAFMEGSHALLAHNAGFDRRVLHASWQALELVQPQLPFLCTLKGARRSLPLASRALDSVCGYFGIPLDHHHAGSDARACAEIYLRLRGLGVTDGQMKL